MPGSGWSGVVLAGDYAEIEARVCAMIAEEEQTILCGTSDLTSLVGALENLAEAQETLTLMIRKFADTLEHDTYYEYIRQKDSTRYWGNQKPPRNLIPNIRSQFTCTPNYHNRRMVGNRRK